MGNKLKISESEYLEMLKKSEDARACEEDIEILKGLSLADALGHKKLPEWLYWYSMYVIRGRWPEAEPIIGKDKECAFCYSVYVIQDRWPEAEGNIKLSEILWNSYKSHFGIE